MLYKKAFYLKTLKTLFSMVIKKKIYSLNSSNILQKCSIRINFKKCKK